MNVCVPTALYRTAEQYEYTTIRTISHIKIIV